jgi:Glycosyl hydrolases family 16
MTKHGLTAAVIVGALISGVGATASASAPLESLISAPSGEAMPVGDLPGWRQIFTDDFTTDVPLGSFPAAVSSKWTAYPSPWKDTSKFGTYSPTKVISVHDGILDKNIHTENGVAMVAAIQPKLAAPVTYGRYAVRFRFDSTVGYKIAWLLWPDSNNSKRDGEIDFPEMNLDSSTAMAFNHHTNNTGAGDQDFRPPALH